MKAIQDRLDCCGFKTTKDRAWPFAVGGVSPDQCVRDTGRTKSCLDPWRGEELRSLGLFLGVGVALGVVKVSPGPR